MEKGYQWSKFIGDNREEQIVVREDNFEDFKEAKANMETLFAKEAFPERPKAPNKPGTPVPVEQYQQTCQRCGGEKVLNPKTGKYFCKAKCWLNK